MENWRRQRWDNQRRSLNKRPPRGNWQPTVPSWERQFCKVVGSMNWGTLLHMKKFIHLYENVIEWDDSAVVEAFHNAKKRYFAEIKGLPCDIPSPDPDLYIDKIDWDNSEIDPKLLSDIENNLVISTTEDNHEPVIIFGDSFLPKQSVTGWGDDEENFKVPNNSSSFNNGGATGWGDYSNDGWGGWNNDNSYEVGPENKVADWERVPWNESRVYAGRYGSSHRGSRVGGNDRSRNHMSRNNEGRHKGAYEGEKSGVDKRAYGPVSNHRGAIPIGQRWNR